MVVFLIFPAAGTALSPPMERYEACSVHRYELQMKFVVPICWSFVGFSRT